MRLSVVGRGRAAAALVPRWIAAGHVLVDQRTRDAAELAAADVVIVAVPDGAIVGVAQVLSGRDADEVWLHLSGSRPASVMRVAERPRAVGCMHPLVALADAATSLEGAVAGVDGEPEAVAIARQLAVDAGLSPVAIDPAHKAAYHAAAVTVAGHATALFAQAMQLMAAAGMGEGDARRALQPLFLSAARNLARGDPAAVSTGPIVRGDAGTIAAHLAAMRGLDPKLVATYRLLAETALALVGARLTPEQRAAISEALR